MVAQEPVLYNGSVRYNILYGCDWATEADMLRAAHTANVHNFVMELEKGYDTNCGEKGVQMCARERTVLIVAHRLSTIEKADQIAVINKGSLVQIGNHTELMKDEHGLYYSLVSKQLLASKIKGGSK
ncbi:unnamed protein product [Strongylus vulgaris]|uniref:ABC transporter domain-containing protein n=1 Tax=Strongylus vulgaris TaxID=40348 RepID=A0A3P7ILK5_STRVU|nr:unnamed protein product [Strongylus vulgaris]